MFRALYKRSPPEPATAGACPQKTHGSELQLRDLMMCVVVTAELDTSQEQTRLSLRCSQALVVGRERKMSKESRLDLPLQIFCRICICQLNWTGCFQDWKFNQSNISDDQLKTLAFLQCQCEGFQCSLSTILHLHSPLSGPLAELFLRLRTVSGTQFKTVWWNKPGCNLFTFYGEYL